MKKLLVVALLGIAQPACAGVIGVLVNSEPIITISGQSAWRCTYNVAGRITTIILREMCPVSEEFE